MGEAVIRDSLVHAQEMKLFSILLADLHVHKKIKVAINWGNIPQSWKMISPYGTRTQMRLNTTAYDLLLSFYVAGNVRMYKTGDDAHPIWVSLYGNFDIKDRKIISNLLHIIKSQRKFLNDFECPYYAISFIEGDNSHSYKGIGNRNGFAAFFPKGMSQTESYALFAHEHLHRWIHGNIRDPKPELKYWWS